MMTSDYSSSFVHCECIRLPYINTIYAAVLIVPFAYAILSKCFIWRRCIPSEFSLGI